MPKSKQPKSNAPKSVSPKSVYPWRVPVVFDDIPESGQHFDLAAPEPVRAALAQTAGLRALTQLQAEFDVEKHGDGLHVKGRVSALAGQNCVVTLEPIDNAIDEAVDLLFMPAVMDERGEPVLAKPAKGRKEPPEPLVGGTVDLGAMACEFLLLGIDPYPRKAGVEFGAVEIHGAQDRNTGQQGDNNSEYAKGTASNPFAVLEALKKGQKGGET